MNQDKEYSTDYNQPDQRPHTGQHRDSEKIRADIYKALREESGIDLHISNGVVRVTGLVDDETSIDYITETIQGIKGVVEVDNKATVKPFNH